MKRFWSVAVVAITLVAAPAQRAVAQEGELIGTGLTVAYVALAGGAAYRLLEGRAPLAIGDEVRVSRANGGERVRGTLTAMDSAGVTVHSASGDVRVATGDVGRIQIYRGRESKWAPGFAIGFASGGVIGASGGFLSGDDEGGDFLSFTAPEKAVILGIAGAIAGSTVGALVGLAVRADHWQRAKRVDLAPVVERGAGAVRLGVRLRY